MHELIMRIGYAILSFFRNIDMNTIAQAWDITLTGYLGIFIVMAVIIAVVWLLNKINS